MENPHNTTHRSMHVFITLERVTGVRNMECDFPPAVAEAFRSLLVPSCTRPPLHAALPLPVDWRDRS